MANIKLNVDTLNAQSASMHDLSEKFVTVQNSLNNELTSMDSNWSSAISTSLSDTVESMKKVFTDMIQELEENATKAEAVAFKFKEADGTIARTDIASVSYEDAQKWSNQKHNFEKFGKNKITTVNIEGREYYSLQTHMNCSFKQSNYEMTVHPSDGSRSYNGGCLATCYAIGGSIITGKSRSPLEYWDSGSEGAYLGKGDASVNVSGWNDGSSASFKTFYDKVTSGKPVIAHFAHDGTGKQHWVVITGIASDADPNHLTTKDFIVADPGTGTYRSFENCLSSYKNPRINGYKYFK